MSKKLIRRYYYHHPESESLWCSNLPPEKEGNPDGCVDYISRKVAYKFLEEYKRIYRELGVKDLEWVDKIPFYINRVLQK